jgi:malate dehydrogenase (oxaloacetate-decarboxylating)(NADP+)
LGSYPDVTETEDLQLSRVMMQLGHKTTDLDRYIYLINLLDHNVYKPEYKLESASLSTAA